MEKKGVAKMPRPKKNKSCIDHLREAVEIQRKLRDVLMNRELTELSIHELNRVCVLLPLISKEFSAVSKMAGELLTKTIEDTLGEKPEL
jgi:hypothetical protein